MGKRKKIKTVVVVVGKRKKKRIETFKNILRQVWRLLWTFVITPVDKSFDPLTDESFLAVLV